MVVKLTTETPRYRELVTDLLLQTYKKETTSHPLQRMLIAMKIKELCKELVLITEKLEP